MQPTTKVYFGTLFEFSKPDEVLDAFRAGFADASSAPFISYDKTGKIFSCEVEKANLQTQTSAFIDQLSSYIELHNRKKRDDVVESPRLRPIGGTAIRDLNTETEPFLHRADKLLQYDEDSNRDSEDESSSLDHVTSYWKPRMGDIRILTHDLAASIADATGCSLFAEPVERRVRLVNGDLHLACQKLHHLEPLLELVAKHRSPSRSRSNASIVFLRPGGREVAIKFVRPLYPNPGFDRIVLNDFLKSTSKRILLAETRFRDRGQIEYNKPVNLDLDEVSVLTEIDSSDNFDKILMPSVGRPAKAKPRSTSLSPVASGEAQILPAPSNFMGVTEASRVTEWSKNVEPQATPNIGPPEPLPEEPVKSRRRMIRDSESDSDSDSDANSDTRSHSQSKRFHSGQLAADHSATLPNSPFAGSLRRRHYPTVSEVGYTVGYSESALEAFSPDKEAQHSSETKLSEKSSTQKYLQRTPRRDMAVSKGNKFDVLGTMIDEPVRFNSGSLDSNDDHDGDHDAKESRSLRACSQDSLVPQEPTDNPTAKISHSNVLEKKFMEVSKQKDEKSEPNSYGGTRRGDSATDKTAPKPPYGRSKSTAKLVVSSPVQRDRKSARPASVANFGPRGDLSPSFQRTLDFRRAGSIGRFSGNETKSADHHPKTDNLVDLDTVEVVSANPIKPPPGLNYRTSITSSSSGFQNAGSEMELSDHRREQSPIQRLQTDASSNITPSIAASAQSEQSPRSTIQKRNIALMTQHKIAELEREIAMRNSDSVRGSNNERRSKNLSPNRKETDSDLASRKYYRTMTQKAPKPAQKTAKPESKKEREARIAKAKADAYGDTDVSKPSKSTLGSATPQPEKMSARKEKLMKKNPLVAAMHPEFEKKQILEEQVQKLLPELHTLFEASRAFNGELRFEVQIGQVLALHNDSMNEALLYKTKDLIKTFDVKRASHVDTIFTNIITANGLEINRAMNVKGPTDCPKLWTSECSEQSIAIVEFLCQDKSGFQFKIMIKDDGKNQLYKPTAVIGKIAVMYPSQIWDACAVLQGNVSWTSASQEIVDGVEQFMNELYIPSKPEAIIYFRQPANGSFTVLDITTKKSITRGCLASGLDEYQLKVTEVRSLVHNIHPTDKTLHRSLDKGYQEMIHDNRLHYEMSISNKYINEVFATQNSKIEVGELTPDTCTGKALLPYHRLSKMVELVDFVVEQADWMGANNKGTLHRLQDELQRNQATIRASLPPQTITHVGINPVNTGTSITVPPATIPARNLTVLNGGSTSVPVGQEPRIVYGVRAGTMAELYQQDGQYFYYGVGGARVPVPDADIIASGLTTTNEVLPGDSASQIGDRTGRPATGPKPHTRKNQQWESKLAGFW